MYIYIYIYDSLVRLRFASIIHNYGYLHDMTHVSLKAACLFHPAEGLQVRREHWNDNMHHNPKRFKFRSLCLACLFYNREELQIHVVFSYT